MPKIAYTSINFRAATLSVIETANEIIAEYQGKGFSLTLRQLYYQFVARDLISNKQEEYDKLGNIISDARMAGLVDWEAIEDRTRYLRQSSSWSSPSSVIESAASGYHIDWWQDQPVRPEVWVEKDALVGIVESAAEPLDTPFFACRGYPSASEVWRAARRIIARQKSKRNPQRTTIIHLGDHDPSGIDMTRDISDRLSMFCTAHGCVPPKIIRVALNMDQVTKYNPPPNPAKITDSRSGPYIAKYGSSSWELDALDPTILADLITRTIRTTIADPTSFSDRQALEEDQRKELNLLFSRYEDAIEAIT